MVDRLVIFTVFPRFQSLDLLGPYEVFAGANDVLAGERRSGPRYELMVVAAAAGPVLTSSGLAVQVDHGLADVPSTGGDTVVVAGGDGAYDEIANAELISWLTDTRPRRLASVCSGSFLLAAAGRLDGRRAATHWARAKRLARRYPAVAVDAEALYVRDGNVWSSAGVTAGIGRP